MGQFKSPDVRSRCIELQQLGWKRLEIATELGLSLGAVKKYIKLRTVRPDTWLYCNYGNCGRKPIIELGKGYRLVRLVKRLHPTWGIPYILVKIQEKYPTLKLHSLKQIYRKLEEDLPQKTKNVKFSHQSHPVESILNSHDCWQIDAKERLRLKNGQEVCYLNVVDQVSGGAIGTRVFSLRTYLPGE